MVDGLTGACWFQVMAQEMWDTAFVQRGDAATGYQESAGEGTLLY